MSRSRAAGMAGTIDGRVAAMRFFLCLAIVLLFPAVPTAAATTAVTVAVTAAVIDPPPEAIASGLTFVPGAVNGALLRRGEKVLAILGDPTGTVPDVDTVLFTHARRDVVWVGRDLVLGGGKAIVPAEEAERFRAPERLVSDLREKRFHDYAVQSTKIPLSAIPVAREVRGGETIEWQEVSIRVIDTPGYTRGAVSYLIEIDGKRIAFTGDLLRDDGKLQDLFSLQDAIPEAGIGGYHGWAGRLGDLVASLAKIAVEAPDIIVPARGPLIRDQRAAIERLTRRIRAVYANYLSIDALRWYFKDAHILAKAARVLGPRTTVDWMPMAETRALPPWIVAISNSRLILAADRSGFLIDCGGTGIIDEVRKLRSSGKLAQVEHVFVTHYHDDHTAAVAALVREFGAKVHACGKQVPVLERPGDFRLPCLTKNPIEVTCRHLDGDTWTWKEFALTIRDFPGQTLYHDALLVARESHEPVLFAGDSFTPSGIDDYCLQNRNFLREDAGYLRLLGIVGTLPPGSWVVNQHVEPMFRFTQDQLDRMQGTLRERRTLLQDLFAFDDPNFGLDEGWAVLHPYAISVRRGETAAFELRITNHSPGTRTFRTAIHGPAGFDSSPPDPIRLGARSEGAIPFTVKVPAHAVLGLQVITADLIPSEGETLREWVEALVEVVE